MSVSSSKSHGASSSSKAAMFQVELPQQSSTVRAIDDLAPFVPCASTASMFLYAQGRSIICCHHDTLTVERRFTKHRHEVHMLVVDNMSEVGGGRLAVSYDIGREAIVWDLMNGEEVAHFISYGDLTVMAWMRDGRLAFGTAQGGLTVFDATTSEHVSSETIAQVGITALAPSYDCRAFAVGYQNGLLLIAKLQPQFTVLHNLTTSRIPSPVITLAWHASSSRQKSDMLATQTYDGDLRVWSVAKSPGAEDPVRVVRILRRGDQPQSLVLICKNSETLSWDVRTKHVTFDVIPTLENVKGLAVYGPGATLFTVGPQDTVQQFDLNSPAIMVANVHHAHTPLPPSPPNSIEEPGEGVEKSKPDPHARVLPGDFDIFPLKVGTSGSALGQLPSATGTPGPHTSASTADSLHGAGSPISNRSRQSFLSKSSSGHHVLGRRQGSVGSRGMTENTFISAASSLRTRTTRRLPEEDNISIGYSLGSSKASSLASSRPRDHLSTLRNEVPRNPEDHRVHELFVYVRARLSDIPYENPFLARGSRRTNDVLRRQMLSTIFGWSEGVEALIKDEIGRHPDGSANRILLSRWLGDTDVDAFTRSSENMTSTDWMIFALSGLGGSQPQQKLGRAFVQRLLESGDVHVAVTVMLGLGDLNDAIETYLSHKRFMEALILTCLVFPRVWDRQAAIVREWGEWAVQHGQQQLAIRCFACSGQDSTEPWSSPSAAQLTFQRPTPGIQEVLSPPLSPPDVQHGPRRSMGKTSALKLITSFGDKSQLGKIFCQVDGGKTPQAAEATPIDASAICPGDPFEAATAFLNPPRTSRFNTPTSAHPADMRLGRHRLPSIGESPSDLKRAGLPAAPKNSAFMPAPRGSSVDRNRDPRMEQAGLAAGLTLLRAATASPMLMQDRGDHAGSEQDNGAPPAPDPLTMTKLRNARTSTRNGSRNRIPHGLSLEVQTEKVAGGGSGLPDNSMTSSGRPRWPTRRRGPGSISSSVTFDSGAGRGMRSRPKPSDDLVQGSDRTADLDESVRDEPFSRADVQGSFRGRRTHRDLGSPSEEGPTESDHTFADRRNPAKRSPTSPIPMSPEDLAVLYTDNHPKVNASTERSKVSIQDVSIGSRSTGWGRNHIDFQDRFVVAAAEDPFNTGDDVSDHRRLPSAPRLGSARTLQHGDGTGEGGSRSATVPQNLGPRGSRSTSRSGASKEERTSEEGLESRNRAAVGAAAHLMITTHRELARSSEHAGDLRQVKDERQRKKELAARELEERRRSLAQRPQAPAIPHPNDIASRVRRTGVDIPVAKQFEDTSKRGFTEPQRFAKKSSNPPLGLPATPKAMKILLEAGDSSGAGAYATARAPIMGDLVTSAPPEASRSSGAAAAAGMTLLPSTVYQPPPRPTILRCMSAPIPEEPRRGRNARKASVGEIHAIDEHIRNLRRRSQESPVSPTSRPPVLKELQHLAIPPPPPPPPSTRQPGQDSQVHDLVPDAIEVVKDDAGTLFHDGRASEALLPAIPARGRNRGRSFGDSGWFGSVPERFRSISRGRREARLYQSTGELFPEHLSTGLHRKEMI